MGVVVVKRGRAFARTMTQHHFFHEPPVEDHAATATLVVVAPILVALDGVVKLKLGTPVILKRTLTIGTQSQCDQIG